MRRRARRQTQGNTMKHRGTYPPNWPEIATEAKAAAGWTCQHCGHPHHPPSGHTLTVHHLDGDKSNCDPENLAVVCQRCHLHLQARFVPGQLSLPGIDPPCSARPKEGTGTV